MNKFKKRKFSKERYSLLAAVSDYLGILLIENCSIKVANDHLF